jgi:hypothetical protein
MHRTPARAWRLERLVNAQVVASEHALKPLSIELNMTDMTDFTPLACKFYLADIERRAADCVRRRVFRSSAHWTKRAPVQIRHLITAAGRLHAGPTPVPRL